MEYSQRKQLRLREYDYSQSGTYFVTICTYERSTSLSRIVQSEASERPDIELTELGTIAKCVLEQLTEQYTVTVDAYVIMPNHIRMVLTIREGEQKVSVGRFVGAFKSIVSNRWREECDCQGKTMGKVWQRNFYDHVVRNDKDYMEKLKYIDENPDKWHEDKLYIK